MAKMTDRELTRLALIDAAAWQHRLAEAHGADTGAGRIAVLRAAQYRVMLERKFGGRQDSDEVRRSVNERSAIDGKLAPERPLHGEWSG